MLELTVLEMVGVSMALVISPASVVQAIQEQSVRLILMTVLELTVVGMENVWMV